MFEDSAKLIQMKKELKDTLIDIPIDSEFREIDINTLPFFIGDRVMVRKINGMLMVRAYEKNPNRTVGDMLEFCLVLD